MPAWKRAILSKQRERSRSQLQRKTTHYYDRDGRKVAVRQDDDDYDNKRRERRGEDDRRGRRKHSEDEGRRSGKGKGKKDKSKGKRRGPTNIDDFDEDDYSDSESGSDSDSSEESGQKKIITSEEAMKMLGTKWALGDGDDIEDLDERIRTQQLEIQRELSGLTQLQRNRGMKALPSLQQKVLQSDLQKLLAIQGKP